MVQGKITEADTLTVRLGATPSGLTSAHLHHPAIFTLDALPVATASSQFILAWDRHQICWIAYPLPSGLVNAVPVIQFKTRMWGSAQHHGRPATYRWRLLFNAGKFG